MSVTSLASLIDRLPPGRARAHYERVLGKSLGDMLAVNVSYADAPLWLVSSVRQVSLLTTRGIPRWRIWTLPEAQEMLDACGSPITNIHDAASILSSPPRSAPSANHEREESHD
jgi:hypothetical protein